MLDINREKIEDKGSWMTKNQPSQMMLRLRFRKRPKIEGGRIIKGETYTEVKVAEFRNSEINKKTLGEMFEAKLEGFEVEETEDEQIKYLLKLIEHRIEYKNREKRSQ